MMRVFCQCLLEVLESGVESVRVSSSDGSYGKVPYFPAVLDNGDAGGP